MNLIFAFCWVGAKALMKAVMRIHVVQLWIKIYVINCMGSMLSFMFQKPCEVGLSQ